MLKDVNSDANPSNVSIYTRIEIGEEESGTKCVE